jgi:hypothetical protein
MAYRDEDDKVGIKYSYDNDNEYYWHAIEED